MKRVEIQEIAVAGDQVVRLYGDGASEDDVVGQVAARRWDEPEFFTPRSPRQARG